MLTGISKNLDFEKLDSLVKLEVNRQQNSLTLIASENYASKKVLEMQGSQLTNKYAEGYPFKRYYAGCEYIDQIEDYGIELAKKLFNADYANLQPHAGSQANTAVLLALLKPGDKFLAMNLSAGGHLTHGAKVSSSGKVYQAIHYGVNDEGFIDYNEVERLAIENQPKIIIAGYSAYPRLLDWKRFREIADKVGALLFADIAHIAGLIAAKLIDSPIDYAHVVTTTTHKTLAGPRGALILSKGQSAEFYRKLNSSIFPGSQGGPLCHVIAARVAALLEASQPEFVEYQKNVLSNAKVMAKVFVKNGFKIITGGTDNHMLLIDVTPSGLTGLDATIRLDRANIFVNQNTIPGETRSPFEASGIRIGSPAITRRGLKEKDAELVANLVIDIINASSENLDQVIETVKLKVLELCKKFPIYN